MALVSNDIKEAVQALEIYRNKDLVEKAFENLKERLDLRRGGRFIGTNPGWQALCVVHCPYLFILYHQENAGNQPL